MLEVDVRAIRRKYLTSEIWMVAVGYGPDMLRAEDRALLKLANNEVSDKPEWPIWSAAVDPNRDEVLSAFLYYSQSEAMERWLK